MGGKKSQGRQTLGMSLGGNWSNIVISNTLEGEVRELDARTSLKGGGRVAIRPQGKRTPSKYASAALDETIFNKKNNRLRAALQKGRSPRLKIEPRSHLIDSGKTLDR